MIWKVDTVYKQISDPDHIIIVKSIDPYTLELQGSAICLGKVWNWYQKSELITGYECIGSLDDYPEYLL